MYEWGASVYLMLIAIFLDQRDKFRVNKILIHAR